MLSDAPVRDLPISMLLAYCLLILIGGLINTLWCHNIIIRHALSKASSIVLSIDHLCITNVTCTIKLYSLKLHSYVAMNFYHIN